MGAVFNVDYSFEWSQWTIESQLELHEESYTHKMLCDYSTHMCFKNLDYKLGFQPKKFIYNEHFTKDGKNVWEMEANFNQRPFVAKLNTPYLVPLFKYLTTPRSFFSTYINQYKMTYKSDNAEVTKELEFTMTDNMIEYG